MLEKLPDPRKASPILHTVATLTTILGRHKPALYGLIAALAAGGLEAAWTGPGRGGPFNVWLGVASILVIMLLATWPKFWLIPALAILEEAVQGFVGTGGLWHPTTATLFDHWSADARFLGVNLYPWLTFPLMTLVVVILVWRKTNIQKGAPAFGTRSE